MCNKTLLFYASLILTAAWCKIQLCPSLIWASSACCSRTMWCFSDIQLQSCFVLLFPLTVIFYLVGFFCFSYIDHDFSSNNRLFKSRICRNRCNSKCCWSYFAFVLLLLLLVFLTLCCMIIVIAQHDHETAMDLKNCHLGYDKILIP